MKISASSLRQTKNKKRVGGNGSSKSFWRNGHDRAYVVTTIHNQIVQKANGTVINATISLWEDSHGTRYWTAKEVVSSPVEGQFCDAPKHIGKKFRVKKDGITWKAFGKPIKDSKPAQEIPVAHSDKIFW